MRGEKATRTLKHSRRVPGSLVRPQSVIKPPRPIGTRDNLICPTVSAPAAPTTNGCERRRRTCSAASLLSSGRDDRGGHGQDAAQRAVPVRQRAEVQAVLRPGTASEIRWSTEPGTTLG